MYPKITIWSAALGEEITFQAIRKYKLLMKGEYTISRIPYAITATYNLAKNNTWYVDFTSCAMRRADDDRPVTKHARRKLADIEDDIQRWWKTLDVADDSSLKLAQSNWEANELRMTLADIDLRQEELERIKEDAGKRVDVLIHRYPQFKDLPHPFEIDKLFDEIEREVAAHNR